MRIDHQLIPSSKICRIGHAYGWRVTSTFRREHQQESPLSLDAGELQ
jgi:hypothetical protein